MTCWASRHGFSLLEMLIAIFLVSIVIAILAQVFPFSKNALRHSEDLSNAVFLDHGRTVLRWITPSTTCSSIRFSTPPDRPVEVTSTPSGGCGSTRSITSAESSGNSRLSARACSSSGSDRYSRMPASAA
ncbi:MAG: prepilin-type N-terminal cleavage/methylation domain-containing protein [Armatimonadetes bacterium]|nr:prepilin-type N-terminal cleavage/methylation domain-containing protein [Armatimonadota bacterium]